MTSFYQQLPKAELHLHLEGAVTPETLCELNPALNPDEVRARYRYPDFPGFLQTFKWVMEHLNTPDHYALVARHVFEELARQNVRYAEINLSAGVALWRKKDFAPIYDAVNREAARSAVQVWWIFDAVRQFGAEAAMEVARLAVERAGDRVVAFGIGGDETRGPAGEFAEVCAFARGHGLKLVPHAGETVGSESVWAALRLGADRIGHGIRSVEDAALMRHLREHQIPLEVCISSNVATGAVASLADHPVRRLFDAGVPLVLNTDDPCMFHTDLSREYELAATEFGFSCEELEQLARDSFRYGFRS
ncbi:MAG: adenosine deaminase [Acidobacteriia bacterium]|nr:adenosine deaminase [Terriglobia bacterium]